MAGVFETGLAARISRRGPGAAVAACAVRYALGATHSRRPNFRHGRLAIRGGGRSFPQLARRGSRSAGCLLRVGA